MDMTISFPGGKKVDATILDQVIRTDQSRQSGGEGSAPEPYLYFLASLGTCAGIYVLGFCQSRNLPTDDLRLIQHMDWNPVSHKLEKITLDIVTPPGFPDKYRDALVRAADMCAVKKTIQDPPAFEIRTISDSAQAAQSA